MQGRGGGDLGIGAAWAARSLVERHLRRLRAKNRGWRIPVPLVWPRYTGNAAFGRRPRGRAGSAHAAIVEPVSAAVQRSRPGRPPLPSTTNGSSRVSGRTEASLGTREEHTLRCTFLPIA